MMEEDQITHINLILVEETTEQITSIIQTDQVIHLEVLEVILQVVDQVGVQARVDQIASAVEDPLEVEVLL